VVGRNELVPKPLAVYVTALSNAKVLRDLMDRIRVIAINPLGNCLWA
jgi:hypothetical protein